MNARLESLPGHGEVQDEVRAYIDLFHADSQPAELAALRAIAATWMERLAAFRPYLTGVAFLRAVHALWPDAGASGPTSLSTS